MPAPTRAAARLAVPPLPPELSRLPEGSLGVYGPVVAHQCDHAGVPIQRYMTILLECSGGAWLLRRLVTSVSKGSASAGQLVEMPITADDARRWLVEHQVSESRA